MGSELAPCPLRQAQKRPSEDGLCAVAQWALCSSLLGSGRRRSGCGGCRSCRCSGLGFLVFGLLGCAFCLACFVLGFHFFMLRLLGFGFVFGVLLFRGFRGLCGSGCCRGGRCCGCRSRCLGKSAKRGDNQSSSDQRLFQHIQFQCMANLPWVLNPCGPRAVYRRCVNLCKAATALCCLAPELAGRGNDGQVGEIEAGVVGGAKAQAQAAQIKPFDGFQCGL